MGNHYRDLKQHDPINFPSDRKIEYQPKTSTTTLRGHIKCFHLLEFLELAQKENWKVFPNKIKLALELGYNVSMLLEVLKQPGVTWSNLPPPPRPTDSSQQDLQPGGEPWDHRLPPFSIAAFHQFLVKFITADDQVHVS